MPWTTEEARANASKGGQAKAAMKEYRSKTPEERARLVLAGKAPRLAEELLKLALGEAGDGEDPGFSQLPAKDRLSAIIRALEWGLGKPATNKDKAESSDKDKATGGLSIE